MNYFKKALRVTVSAATTLSLGVLSLVGALLLFSSIKVAIASFFLAVAIEGTVYDANIYLAFLRLGNQKKYLKLAIAKRELKKLQLQNKKFSKFKDNDFLRDYINQKNYLHVLEENSDYYEKGAEEEIERVKRRLEMMESLFLECIEKKKKRNGDENSIIDQIISLTENQNCIKANALNEEVNRKNFYMNCSIGLATGAGICSALISLANFHSSLLLLGISVSVGSLVPIVGLVGVGYALMMYRTVTDMIQNETLKEWVKNIRDFWHQEDKNFYDYLTVAGLITVIGIAIAATIATGGTWWYFAKAGSKLISHLPAIAESILSIATWVCAIVFTLLFNLVSTLNSAKKIPGIAYRFVSGLANDIATAWHKENFLQFFNPFRVVCKLFKAFVFTGHLVSIAVASDRCPFLRPAESTFFNSTGELLIDSDYIAKGDHDHAHPIKKGGAHKGHHHSKKTTHHNHKHSHEHCEDAHQNGNHHGHHHGHGHGHGHHHGQGHGQHACDEDDEGPDHDHHGVIIIDQIEKALNYVSIAWDLLSRWTVDYILRQTSSYTLAKSKQKIMGTKNLPDVPTLSKAWTRYETDVTFDEQSKKYAEKEDTEKAIAFQKLKISTDQPPSPNSSNETDRSPTLAQKLQQSIGDQQPLSQHRDAFCRFSKAPPASMKTVDHLLHDRSLDLQCR